MATLGDTLYVQNMPFMNRLIDSTRPRATKRQRQIRPPPSDYDMAFFAPLPTQSLVPPSKKQSQRTTTIGRNEIDDYLDSDDLEASFASNVSLNSPPRRPSGLPESDAMDISPMPPPKSKLSSGAYGTKAVPRPLFMPTQNSRLFGSDLSNSHNANSKPVDVPPTKSATTANRKLSRAALPTEWLASHEAAPEPQSVCSDSNDRVLFKR